MTDRNPNIYSEHFDWELEATVQVGAALLVRDDVALLDRGMIGAWEYPENPSQVVRPAAW